MPGGKIVFPESGWLVRAEGRVALCIYIYLVSLVQVVLEAGGVKVIRSRKIMSLEL